MTTTTFATAHSRRSISVCPVLTHSAVLISSESKLNTASARTCASARIHRTIIWTDQRQTLRAPHNWTALRAPYCRALRSASIVILYWQYAMSTRARTVQRCRRARRPNRPLGGELAQRGGDWRGTCVLLPVCTTSENHKLRRTVRCCPSLSCCHCHCHCHRHTRVVRAAYNLVSSQSNQMEFICRRSGGGDGGGSGGGGGCRSVSGYAQFTRGHHDDGGSGDDDRRRPATTTMHEPTRPQCLCMMAGSYVSLRTALLYTTHHM